MYALYDALYFRNAIFGGLARVSFCGGCYDTAQQQWFVGVPGHLLAGGHLPFYTNLLNYPEGSNLLQSSISTVPALIVEPVTQLFGPIAAVNVEMMLGPFLCAVLMYVALGRWVRWIPARILGGFIYGFSPFEIHSSIHIFLVFSISLPLLAMVLDDLLRLKLRSPIKIGLSATGVFFLAYFTSAEIFVTLLIMSVISVGFYLISTKGRAILPHIYVIRSVVVAGVSSFLVLIYPIYFQLFGLQHYSGPPQQSMWNISSDFLSPFLSSPYEWLGTHQMTALSVKLVQGISSENTLYLGLPLLVLLLVSCKRQNWWVSASLLSAGVLSFGPQLHVAGNAIGVPLPEIGLLKLPFLNALIPSRFSLFVFFFAGIQIALWLDHIKGTSFNKRRIYLVFGASLFCLIPLIPLPVPMQKQSVPSFFKSTVTSVIPQDSVVVSYPFPTFVHQDAMIWQAFSHYSFSLPGGYIYVPNSNGHATLFPSVDSQIATTLDAIYEGQNPEMTQEIVQSCRQELRSWGVNRVISSESAPYSREANRVLSIIIGKQPQYSQGIFYWAVKS